MKRVCLVAWLAIFASVGLRMANGQEIEFCMPPLKPALMQAHMSFTAVYGFNVSKDGVPSDIKPVAQAYSNPEEMEACMRNWKLPGEAGKKLIATFEWEHAVGWKRITISGPGVSLAIRLSGERCSYCPK